MPRIIRNVTAVLFAVFAAVLLPACSSHDFNPTTVPYQIDRDALAKKPIKKVIIATANVSGEPTRYFLQKPATRIDAKIKRYLEANGYQVAPGYQFENAYSQAVRTYGNLYDPTSGRVDPATWRAVMISTMKALQDTDIDAIVFTDVIERDTAHNVGIDHLAQFDGVSRKPGFISAGGGSVSQNFDWNRTLKAATLVITIYNVDLAGVFTGRGGLDTLQVIGKNQPATYVRRKKALDNDDNVEEGIEIAFHPFIPMKDYPGREGQ